MLSIASTTKAFISKSSKQTLFLFQRKMASTSNFISIPEAITLHQKKASIFLDGSWHLGERDGRKEYEAGPRIQGAQFFDIDDVATIYKEKNLPHMMPSKELFSHAMDHLGISNDCHAIVYGTEGCFSIPRAFYGFKAMGHNNVKVLKGSLKEWIDANGPIETEKRESFYVKNLDLSKDASYKATDPQNVVDKDFMLDIVNEKNKDCIIVDARSAGRFTATEPEPRPGLRGGHMPGAFNVPFNTLLDDENKNLRSKEEIVNIFKEAGVDIDTEKTIVTTCGSGVTASWLSIALEECGRDPSKIFLYDGSWIEWASSEGSPIVTKY